MAEGLVLLQFTARQVVQARQLQRLIKVVGRLAAAVQQLQVALLCKAAAAGQGAAGVLGRVAATRAASAWLWYCYDTRWQGKEAASVGRRSSAAGGAQRSMCPRWVSCTVSTLEPSAAITH